MGDPVPLRLTAFGELVRTAMEARERVFAEVIWQLAPYIDRGAEPVLRVGFGREIVALSPNGPDVFEVRTVFEAGRIVFEAIPIGELGELEDG